MYRHVILGVLLVAQCAASPAAGAGRLVVSTNDGLISIDARSVSLREVCEEIEKETGIPIKFHRAAEPQVVNLSLSSLALESALRQLLRETSGYVIERGVGPGTFSGVRTVSVFAGERGAVAPVAHLPAVVPGFANIPQIALPETIKAHLLDAEDPGNHEVVNAIRDQRSQVLNQLFKDLDSPDGISNPAIDGVRKKLEEIQQRAGNR